MCGLLPRVSARIMSAKCHKRTFSCCCKCFGRDNGIDLTAEHLLRGQIISDWRSASG